MIEKLNNMTRRCVAKRYIHKELQTLEYAKRDAFAQWHARTLAVQFYNLFLQR